MNGSSGLRLHPNTFVILGAGLKTDEVVRFSGGKITVDQPPSGDGAVHQGSASSFVFPKSAVKERKGSPNAEHSVILTFPNVIQMVVSFIKRIRSTP